MGKFSHHGNKKKIQYAHYAHKVEKGFIWENCAKVTIYFDGKRFEVPSCFTQFNFQDNLIVFTPVWPRVAKLIHSPCEWLPIRLPNQIGKKTWLQSIAKGINYIYTKMTVSSKWSVIMKCYLLYWKLKIINILKIIHPT